MSDQSKAARAFRIGIDVGGTFTKAVLIDNASRQIVGRFSVMTTHDHERGVAAGVVEVFRSVLSQSGVHPDEVVFLAHSTTQATNALLEGDVAKVGIVGMAGRAAAELAEAQVRIDPIGLGPGRVLDTANRFLVSDELSKTDIVEAIEALQSEGAEVLVASSAFGVDTTGSEETVRELASQAGLLTTCGHEVTRLYGLTTRTRTAVINASILPTMNATANMTEASVREAGIKAPLMIMRGDGGVMDIREMRRRPAMTMLSGPAASVAGALMHLRVYDGLYFEVGGTSTNIGVIRSGRPAVTYATVGGHETYVSSLDVRVLGVAGGSLIRLTDDGTIADVGPRSAHIAGLPYAAFAEPAAIVEPVLELFEPKSGDGANFVAVRSRTGERYALTTTCAANILGYANPGHHAFGHRESAERAFVPLAERMGLTVADAARRVLDCASDKILPVVETLVREYKLDPDQCLLVGEGGGAAALVPYVAERTNHKHEISKDAEVISSIGVALALVRDVVERVVPHPKPEDLQAIREEAVAAAVRLGAHPQSVDVTIEVDRHTNRVRAIAMGAAEMQVRDDQGGIPEPEARRVAARSMDIDPSALDLVATTEGFRIYREPGGAWTRVRAVDWMGSIRIRRRGAQVHLATSMTAPQELARQWPLAEAHSDHEGGVPEVLLVHGRKVLDLSGVETLEQALALIESEFAEAPANEKVVIVVCVRLK